MAISKIGSKSITDGSVTGDDLASGAVEGAFTSQIGGRRNLIVNGAMTVAQRGTSGTMAGDNEFVSLDRWGTRTYGGTGRFSVAQDTTVPSGQTFTKSLKATVTTTDTSGTYGYAIKQNLEGYVVNPLRTGTSDARKSTLSFWARSSVAGTYCFSVRGTAGVASYVFEYTLAADTWTKIEHTIAEPTTTTPSWDRTSAADFLLEWSLGGQTSKQTSTTESWHDGNYTSTSNQTDWISNSGATFYLTGVQLEAGETATPFEHLGYGEELALCQRYCETFLHYGDGFTTPNLILSARYSSSGSVVHVWYRTTKRTDDPDLTYSTSGNSGNLTLYNKSGTYFSLFDSSDVSFQGYDILVEDEI